MRNKRSSSGNGAATPIVSHESVTDEHIIDGFKNLHDAITTGFDSMRKDMDERFTALRAEMDERFGTVDERFGQLEHTAC